MCLTFLFITQDLELIYFNDFYISDPSTRPTYRTAEDTMKILGVILDSFDTVENITEREILCTATYVDDLAVYMFLRYDSGELGSYSEMVQILMVRN